MLATAQQGGSGVCMCVSGSVIQSMCVSVQQQKKSASKRSTRQLSFLADEHCIFTFFFLLHIDWVFCFLICVLSFVHVFSAAIDCVFLRLM